MDRKAKNQHNSEVIALSELLKQLPIHTDRPDAVRFRNPNGVALKLANFLALDPSHSSLGMRLGGKLDRVVWDEFVDDRERLSHLAAAIRAGYQSREISKPAEDQDELEFTEGRVAFRLHRSRERSAALVRRKKGAVLAKTGNLKCEVCRFDFHETYGDLGEGFIECHPIHPVSELKADTKIKLSDLVVVCSNCHRMLHRRRPWFTAADLRVLVTSDLATA